MNSSRLRFWSGMAAMAVGICWTLWTVAPWTPLLVPALLLSLPVTHSLQMQRPSSAPRWSVLGCILGMGGATASAVVVTVAVGGANASAGTLELAVVLGLVVMAGGLALLGLVAVRSTAPSHLGVPPLMLGGLIPIFAGWFWLFIANRTNPPLATGMTWVALGVIIGISWGYLGQALIRSVAHTSSCRVN